MKIGILAAMKQEIDELVNRMDNSNPIKIFDVMFYDGKIGDNEVTLALAGIGKVNASIAATLLIREFNCSYIINTGIAGGTKPLKTRDVVIAKSVAYSDFDLRVFGYEYGQVPGLPVKYMSEINNIVTIKAIFNKLGVDYKYLNVLSSDKFITSYDMIKDFDKEDGIVLEMEGCAVAQTATKAGVDYLILRYISDIVGEKSQIEDYFAFESEMAKRSAEICAKLVENLE